MDLEYRGDVIEWTYYGAFFAAIGWCFVRPVGVGTRDLLWACAVLTVAIPVADAAVLGMPIWRSLALEAWPLVCVSGVSLLSAVIFWRMAASMHRRLQNGDVNSVWAGAGTGLPNAQVADR
jgi:hypothetical protein